MEENIDLEPQLHAMMCPDMAAAPGPADSQMLLGSGPGSRQRRRHFHVVTLQANKRKGRLFTVFCQDRLPPVKRIPPQSTEKEEKAVGCWHVTVSANTSEQRHFLSLTRTSTLHPPQGTQNKI